MATPPCVLRCFLGILAYNGKIGLPASLPASTAFMRNTTALCVRPAGLYIGPQNGCNSGTCSSTVLGGRGASKSCGFVTGRQYVDGWTLCCQAIQQPHIVLCGPAKSQHCEVVSIWGLGPTSSRRCISRLGEQSGGGGGAFCYKSTVLAQSKVKDCAAATLAS